MRAAPPKGDGVPLERWIVCAACLLAGVAIGYFVRSRKRVSAEALMRRHDRPDADGVRRLSELMERKWGVSALPSSPASEKEDDS